MYVSDTLGTLSHATGALVPVHEVVDVSVFEVTERVVELVAVVVRVVVRLVAVTLVVALVEVTVTLVEVTAVTLPGVLQNG